MMKEIPFLYREKVYNPSTGKDKLQYYFIKSDCQTLITNPYLSECARFPVKPCEYYGITLEQLETMTKSNNLGGYKNDYILLQNT